MLYIFTKILLLDESCLFFFHFLSLLPNTVRAGLPPLCTIDLKAD